MTFWHSVLNNYIYYTINYVTCKPVIWTSISTLCRRTTDWDNGCRICRTHAHRSKSNKHTHKVSTHSILSLQDGVCNTWPPFVNVKGRGECARGSGMGGQNLNAIVSIYHGCRKICNQQQRRANLLQAQIASPHHCWASRRQNALRTPRANSRREKVEIGSVRKLLFF